MNQLIAALAHMAHMTNVIQAQRITDPLRMLDENFFFQILLLTHNKIMSNNKIKQSKQ